MSEETGGRKLSNLVKEGLATALELEDMDQSAAAQTVLLATLVTTQLHVVALLERIDERLDVAFNK